MIRSHVLAALAAGIAAGDEDAARAALGKIDWILQGRARRRLERLLIDAALAASPSEDVVHIQRLAALGVRSPDPTDRAAVAAAYAALPVPRPPRAPIATVVAALLACVAIAGVALAILGHLDPAQRTYQRPMPPPGAGAFQAGGVPLEDPAIAALLVGDFTQYVLVVDGERRTFGKRHDERTTLAARLRVAPAMQRAPALAAAWLGLVDALGSWVTVPLSSPQFQTIADDLRARARTVSDQLAALGVGYYVEASVFTSGDTAHATIYAYRIDEVVYVDGRTPMRVLDLHRIDQLNLVHALLGMESSELGDPLVMGDQIDEHVATVVLPALAVDADFPLAGTWLTPEEQRWEDPGKLGHATGEAVRRELATALGADAAATAKVAGLLVERGKLFASWKEPLSHRNLRMAQIDTLFVPAELVAQFHERMVGVVPTDQLDRAAAIEDELVDREAPRLASRIHELVARSVRHHEAQHGFDDARPTKLRYPEALAEHVGVFENQQGEPRPAAEHANAELSAYTSQIANDLVTPQLALWSMARHAFTEHRWGTAESYVAVIVLDGLARHLGMTPHDPIIHDGEIDRIRLSAIAARLPTHTAAELRRAAADLWQELYGEPLAPITDRSATIAPP